MIQLSTTPTSATVTITGDLDIAERDRFPEVTARLRSLRRSLVVLDLCGTTFLDSTGAAFLASVAQTASRRGGIAVLRGAGPRELFVLEVCGALPLFRADGTHRCPPPAEGGAPGEGRTRAAQPGPQPTGPMVAPAGRATLLPRPEGGQPTTGG
jgi:anti-anti-sigma factor